MSFLRRILGASDERGPDWASFMTAAAYRQFETLVVADLTARGYTVQLTGDGGVETQGGPNPGMYGLTNLAQVCHAIEPSEWPGAINRHFNGLAAAMPGADESYDLETVRPLLRVRVYRLSDSPAEMLERVIRRDLGPDLTAALAIDLPTTVRTTNQDDIDKWALDVDELFAIGAANLAGEVSTYERTTIPMRDGFGVEFMFGDSFFVASQVCRFAEIVGPAPNGALVALPNRHQIAWHVIDGAAGTVLAAQLLLRIGSDGYREGPGSLTPDLYWWRDGTLTLLPASVDKKGINFMPPDAFIELLNSLS